MAWMTKKNDEALEARGRSLSTAPLEIAGDRVDAMAGPCRTFIQGLYTLDGDRYRLPEAALPLSDSDRLRIIECLGLPNGIRMILVTLAADKAVLEVTFFNRNCFEDIELDPAPPHRIFPISGGHRLRAGGAEGEVRVEAIHVSPDEPVITLDVAPIGDYSEYTLEIDALGYPNMDPLSSEMPFKFRPGCFSADCAPEWEPGVRRAPEPTIDYLAKDYDSFKHTMISAMMARVPQWQSTSEADLDQVLLELFSVAADELSDFQDRVANEAYLGSARKRVSLARHARLMDYHIHEGNQASAWLALYVQEGEEIEIPEGFCVWAGREKLDADAVVFLARKPKDLLLLFGLDQMYLPDFIAGVLSSPLKEEIDRHGICLSSNLQVDAVSPGEWSVEDQDYRRTYTVRQEGRHLMVYAANRRHYLLNRLELYTWSDAVPALEAGSTAADLKITAGVGMTEEETAYAVQNLLCEGSAPFLLVQEWRDPGTGREGGRNPEKRQLLQLLKGRDAARAMQDPVTLDWTVRIQWEEKDGLKNRYCFLVDCPDEKVRDVSLFHGNLVEVFHGWPKESVFEEYTEEARSLGTPYLKRTDRWGCIAELPSAHMLAFRNTDPGGDIAPDSTLSVEVETSGGVVSEWNEVISLVGSDKDRAHFVVETDELRRSLIRFGNGTNGKVLPLNCRVRCRYQVGDGPDGNVGADTLVNFNLVEEDVEAIDPPAWSLFDHTAHCSITRCWNPFDITSGRSPEPASEIIRRVPEFFRYRQLRAVTLKDYETRAEALEEVSRAAARYMWTGSWRTVRITVDPKGTTELTQELHDRLADHLNTVRLIGEDLEIRAPRFVPLSLQVTLCIHPDYWPEDIEHILYQEFSDQYTPDGRQGFFHPDLWSFGQPLRESQIIGRVQSVTGVDHIVSLTMKRWNEATPGTEDVIEVRPHEIILVKNDPDHMEKGSIFFDVRGGRR